MRNQLLPIHLLLLRGHVLPLLQDLILLHLLLHLLHLLLLLLRGHVLLLLQYLILQLQHLLLLHLLLLRVQQRHLAMMLLHHLLMLNTLSRQQLFPLLQLLLRRSQLFTRPFLKRLLQRHLRQFRKRLLLLIQMHLQQPPPLHMLNIQLRPTLLPVLIQHVQQWGLLLIQLLPFRLHILLLFYMQVVQSLQLLSSRQRLIKNIIKKCCVIKCLCGIRIMPGRGLRIGVMRFISKLDNRVIYNTH